MKVTPEQLERQEACQPQLDLFTRLFPDGVEITRELCVKHAQDFNWDWAAGRLLTPSERSRYGENAERRRAQRAYARRTRDARKAYYQATQAVWEALRPMISQANARKAYQLAVRREKETLILACAEPQKTLNLGLAEAFFAATQH